MPQHVRVARRDDSGFTLVELLVVLVILSVLAGIVAFGVAQFRTDSVSGACRADRNIVTTAANAYELQEGEFPNSLTELETKGYLKEPSTGVRYSFDTGTNTVKQDSCNL